MTPLTAMQLAARLIDSLQALGGNADTSEVIGIVSAMLVIKRSVDQPGPIAVHSSDPLLEVARASQPTEEFTRLIKEVEQNNPRLLDGVLTNLPFPRNIKPAQLRECVDLFAGMSLSDENLVFGDTVGEAYDLFLAGMAYVAGKREGEIFTPAEVAGLMVRIAAPSSGQSVCDPFTGVGEFLTTALEFVRESEGGASRVSVYGQEINIQTWAIAKVNLLLHGVDDAAILVGDTLANPAHKSADGRLKAFDRVLTHAQFSMNYDKRQLSHQERMRYGWSSEHGRADLMIVQHVLASLAPSGLGVVLAPLGILFRGGSELGIRRGMIKDGRIDTVIGLGSSILPNSSIPACVLILRGPRSSRFEGRDDVLFINAEQELTRSRGINRLGPEAIEKIVDVYRDRADLPGFSRVVSLAEIEANEFNLSVRPYADQGLPPEAPADATAIISGGVPRGEVQAAEGRFSAFGVDLANLFLSGNSGYLSFLPEGYTATARTLESRTAPKEREFTNACRAWWNESRRQFIELADEQRLLRSRPQLSKAFRDELRPANLLDEYQLSGVFAAWWSAWHDDLRVLEHYGFQGVLDRWIASGVGRSRNFQGEPTDEVLDAIGADLVTRAQTLVVTERQKLVDIYLAWGERYGTSLLQLEDAVREARGRLDDRLSELGYIDPWSRVTGLP